MSIEKGKNKYLDVLKEPIDSGVLERMPSWFRRLRETYQKGDPKDKISSDSTSESQVSITEAEFIQIVKILLEHLR